MTREDAKVFMRKEWRECMKGSFAESAFEIAIEALEQPERKKGRWIKITTGAMREKYMCSICGRTIQDDGIERLVRIRYPFCHCGAEMTEDSECQST